MLTTSRREIVADNADTLQNQNTTVTDIDTKTYGKQAFDLHTQIIGATNAQKLNNSYFAAEDQDITVKLFGKDIPLEYIDAVETADAENFSNPDLMPSSSTMENHFTVSTPYYNTKYNTTPIPAIKLTKKNKLAIVSYVALVLALVLIISLTAVAVNSTMKQVSDLQISINDTMAQIDQMYVDAQQNADSYAAELGLTSVESAETQYYTPVATREAAEYDLPSNWFDKLCVWVSNVFGG